MDEFAQVIIEFNNKASNVFFSSFETFRNAVKNLDRQKDENVFQHQQARFQGALKNQLEFIAKDLLEKNQPLKNTNQLNKKFTDVIKDYLNQFRQKSVSL